MNNKPQNVMVGVVDQERFDRGPFVFGDGTDGSLNRVIDSLLAIRESIPAEFRDVARCEISYIGDGSLSVEIGYVRPETDEERIARQAQEAAQLARQEAAARASYEMLKAKFEGQA